MLDDRRLKPRGYSVALRRHLTGLKQKTSVMAAPGMGLTLSRIKCAKSHLALEATGLCRTHEIAVRTTDVLTQSSPLYWDPPYPCI